MSADDIGQTANMQANKENVLAQQDELIRLLEEHIGVIGSADFQQMSVHRVKYRIQFVDRKAELLQEQQRMAFGFVEKDERAELQRTFNALEAKLVDARAIVFERLAQLEAAAAPPPPAAPAAVVQPPLAPVEPAFSIQSVVNTWGKFDGNPLNWFDFKGRFKIAVHDFDDKKFKP